MGTWSISLYGNDIAGDVRDTYVNLLKEQKSDEEAQTETIEQYQECMGTDEECFVWYALADTQWKNGRLNVQVKEKALVCIERQEGCSFWEENKKALENWKTILERLKIQLETPMPEKKKYRKKARIVCNPWKIGDVYAYQFSTEYSKDKNLYGKYILFQKIGDSDWCNETYSRVYIFDKLFDKLPQLSEIKIEELRILPMDLPERFFSKNKEDLLPLNMNALMIIYKKGDYPEKNLIYLGNTKIEIRTPNYQNRDVFSWYRLEEDPLCDYYWEWQKCKYTSKNGEYYVIV